MYDLIIKEIWEPDPSGAHGVNAFDVCFDEDAQNAGVHHSDYFMVDECLERVCREWDLRPLSTEDWTVWPLKKRR